MRKSLILMFLLLISSIALIVGVNTSLDEKKTAVSIDETVLYGDKTAARGIEITNKTQYDSHLFWDTSYSPGMPSGRTNPRTAFRFSADRQYQTGIMEPSMYLSYNLNYSMGGSGIDLEGSENRYLMAKPAVDAASRTAPGETRKEVLALRDYYEYYQIDADIYNPYSRVEVGDDEQEQLTRYFQLPVSEDHKIQVSVTKDQSGGITDVGCSSVSGENWFNGECVVTSSGAYCAATYADSVTGDPLPLPDGISGVHYLPFQEEDGVLRPAVDKMRLAYPLDASEQVSLLRQTPEKDELLLFTRRGGSFYLTVIDTKTMKPLQETEIHSDSAGVGICDVQYPGGSLVVVFTDGSFRLLAPRDGVYELALEEDLYDSGLGEGEIQLYNMSMSYDGTRLAAAFYQEPYRRGGFYLLVYTEDGLAFAGRYDQSSDRTVPEGGKIPLPLDYNAHALEIAM